LNTVLNIYKRSDSKSPTNTLWKNSSTFHLLSASQRVQSISKRLQQLSCTETIAKTIALSHGNLQIDLQ